MHNLHVHDDIELIKHIMPAMLYRDTDLYVMQEDRVVFVGNRENVKNFVAKFDGKKKATYWAIKKDKQWD